RPSAGAAAAPAASWSAESGPVLAAGTGSPFFASFSFFLSGSTAAGAMVASGGEVSCCTSPGESSFDCAHGGGSDCLALEPAAVAANRTQTSANAAAPQSTRLLTTVSPLIPTPPAP